MRKINENEKEKEVVELYVPQYAASALINDDYSGLTDEEKEEVINFRKECVEEYGNDHFMLPPDDEQEEDEFSRMNDMNDLAGSTIKLYLFDETDERKDIEEK